MTYEEGEKLAKDNGLMFLETSAKSSYNVEESFNLSSQMILSNMEKNKSPYEEKVMSFNLLYLIIRKESVWMNRNLLIIMTLIVNAEEFVFNL